MTAAETKLGYKQTELGWIPEEWEVRRFEEVLEGFSSGMTPYRAIKNYYTGDIPWITSGELNYNVITDTYEKITLQAVKKTNLKILPKGTFLFAITGLEAAGTRGSCGITGIEATTNQSCMALYPKKDKMITPYLFHYYVRYGNELAFQYCQGTKQQSYTGRIAKGLPIIVPSTIKEQTAIATALSDMDSYIRSLEALIAKKRLIKQGAMQELLTPKEDWEVKEIGSEIDLLTGFPFPSSNYSESGIRLLRGSNIKRGNTDWSEEITQYWPEITSQIRNYELEEGDIVIAMDGSLVGKSFAQLSDIDLPALLLQRVARVRSKKISMNYLKEFICSEFFTRHCDAVKTSSAIPHISPDDIRKFKIPIPPSGQEQESIAQTMRDMAKEIEVLEVQKLKALQLKQGMMQELLTGRTRLV